MGQPARLLATSVALTVAADLAGDTDIGTSAESGLVGGSKRGESSKQAQIQISAICRVPVRFIVQDEVAAYA